MLDSKMDCGVIAMVFTSDLSIEESVSFLYDLVTLDFFQDLSGKMKDFLLQIKPSIRTLLEASIANSLNVGSDGDLVESDEDSDGNLRFVLVIYFFEY